MGVGPLFVEHGNFPIECFQCADQMHLKKKNMEIKGLIYNYYLSSVIDIKMRGSTSPVYKMSKMH